MAETFGKCTNFASCTLAYRNQPIPYSGNPVCPECGQPLTTTVAGAGRSPLALIGIAVGAAVLLGGGLFFFFSRHSTPPQAVVAQSSGEVQSPSPMPRESERPEPATAPAMRNDSPSEQKPSGAEAPSNVEKQIYSPNGEPTPVKGPGGQSELSERPSATLANNTPTPQTIAGLMPGPSPSDDAEPVSVEKNIDTNMKGGENQRVKSEVLKRIDQIPNLSKADKDKLYSRVDRAKGMGKVITVPFAFGARSVGAREVDQLKSALKSPQAASLIKDPTVVFVLLGFADKSGDEKANQKISLDRAEHIAQTLKDKCAMDNVTQPVGMGGSALFDSGNFAKNRVVEVWAVVP